jgi:holo-ACP synthase
VQIQASLLAKYEKTLVSFKLNIPGAVKYNELIKQIFDEGIQALQCNLIRNGMTLLVETVDYKQSGPEFFGVVAVESKIIKQVTWAIEESHPLGRLYDFDIIDKNGKQCGRQDIQKANRKCFLCDQPAFACARSRAHSVADMLSKIQAMYNEYFQ